MFLMLPIACSTAFATDAYIPDPVTLTPKRFDADEALDRLADAERMLDGAEARVGRTGDAVAIQCAKNKGTMMASTHELVVRDVADVQKAAWANDRSAYVATTTQLEQELRLARSLAADALSCGRS